MEEKLRGGAEGRNWLTLTRPCGYLMAAERLSDSPEEDTMSKKQAVVAQADELRDGQMKQVSVEGTDVLLTRVNGQYHAVGA